jgi:membrane protease YdiL (CAAX protease family)
LIEKLKTRLSLLPQMSLDKRERLIDLLVVLLLMFIPPIFDSTHALLAGNVLYNKEMKSELLLGASIRNVSGIIFLIYILARQKRTLHDIGVSFSFWDIPISVLLYGAQLLCHQMTYSIADYLHHALTGNELVFSVQNIEFLQTSITVWYILGTITNPLFEELLVRGYVMTEVKYVWAKTSVAIVASVVIQLLYHTYQGLWPLLGHTVTFLLAAAYFAKWKRITPVVLAHFYNNLYSMIYEASRI